MIERFNDLLNKYDLKDKVELKGSFCMERCGEGVNWQIDDQFYSSSSVEEAVEIFQREVVTPNIEND
jgi:NADH:ubiquinone oxidoreductase subunit E